MAIARTRNAELVKIPEWAKNTVLIVGASLLLGLSTHLAIPLPFTPVPLVTRVTIVLLLGVLLGSKRAPLAVALFLLQGALGLPVFLNGPTGLAAFAGPTAGYLFGYVIAAHVVGKIVEINKERTLMRAFLAMAVGNGIVLALGSAWLSTLVGLQKALWLGVAPFLIGDLIKLTLAAKILKWMGWHSNKT